MELFGKQLDFMSSTLFQMVLAEREESTKDGKFTYNLTSNIFIYKMKSWTGDGNNILSISLHIYKIYPPFFFRNLSHILSILRANQKQHTFNENINATHIYGLQCLHAAHLFVVNQSVFFAIQRLYHDDSCLPSAVKEKKERTEES